MPDDVKTLDDEDLLAWPKEEPEVSPGRRIGRGRQCRFKLATRLGEPRRVDRGLGASEQSALHSQVRRIIEHPLNIEDLPGPGPLDGWRAAIVDARVEIEVLLERHPGLRSGLTSTEAAGHKRGARKIIAGLELYRELKLPIIDRLRATTFTAGQPARFYGDRPGGLALNTHDRIGGDIRLLRPYICCDVSLMTLLILV